jgi:hypothetical protein
MTDDTSTSTTLARALFHLQAKIKLKNQHIPTSSIQAFTVLLGTWLVMTIYCLYLVSPWIALSWLTLIPLAIIGHSKLTSSAPVSNEQVGDPHVLHAANNRSTYHLAKSELESICSSCAIRNR